MESVLINHCGFREGIPSPKKVCDEYYQPPAHRDKLLGSLNSHTRDNEIEFYEQPHKYVVQGDVMSCSVTTLASSFREPFDSHLVIHRMMSSKREAWPRLKYVINNELLNDNNISLYNFALLYDKTSNKTVSQLILNDDDNIQETTTKLHKAAEINGHSSHAECVVYVYERGMTKEEIIQEWKLNGKRTSSEGTEAHYQMELLLNNEPHRDDPEVMHGINFLKDIIAGLGGMAYRTEWEIFSTEAHIAGSVDAIFKKPNGNLILVDWKRSDKLEEHMSSFGKPKYMEYPLNHLEDCDGAQYCLQLSLYKYIIETKYNMKVDELFVCSIHPDKPYYKQLLFLEEEVKFLMTCREEWVKKWIQISRETDEQLKCKLSNRIPLNPCMCKGELVDRKMLLVEEEIDVVDPILESEIFSRLPTINYGGFNKKKKLKL
jgi:hypothetical protein